MRRTQLYLDESLWNVLHAQARRQKTTISELVRLATRQQYMSGVEERGSVMRELVGVRKDRSETPDTAAYIRELRSGSRVERLHKQ